MGSNESGCFGILLIVVDLAILVFSGILAWNWIEPESFWQVISFLITWGLLASVGYFVAMFLFKILFDRD